MFEYIILDPFDLNKDGDVPLSDLNPDLAFYNNIQHVLYHNSDYFDKSSFNRLVSCYVIWLI